ncbi:MAG: HEPN domain-containing protein [Promethearchaeota archaeon]
MSIEEVNLLFQRARNFLDSSKDRLDKKDWDLTCFLSEQALQLYLKATILELKGDVPKTYSLRKLIALINQISEVKINVDRNSLLFLESSYLNAREINFIYEKEDAENALNITEEVINKIEDIRRNYKFGFKKS